MKKAEKKETKHGNKKTRRIVMTGFTAICVCVCLLLGILYYSGLEPVDIVDEDTPLVEPGMTLVREGEEDLKIIPDKYNTGCKEQALVTVVNGAGTYGDVNISEYGKDTLAIRMKGYKSSQLAFENVDFSKYSFVITDEDAIAQNCTIRFVNCKFSSLRIVSNTEVSRVSHIFENCSFVHFEGSNATFENSYFGSGSMGDGVNPARNCTFKGCMIADLVQPALVRTDNHVDGFQVFGDSSANHLDNKDIYFENCRFEVPNIPYSSSSGILNCPITFTMRYSNASNIGFSDCIVNGGTYYSIMINSGNYSIDNIMFENVRVGGSRKSGNITGDVAGLNQFGISDLTSLYVASVWKDGGKIHLSVTNDTNQERTLKIVTSNGTIEKVIPACPVSYNVPVDSMDYEDFPFDLDITVDNADWVVCYDVTDGSLQQIRCVNWTNENIYVNTDALLQNNAAESTDKKQNASNQNVSNQNVIQIGTGNSVAADGLFESTQSISLSGVCGAQVAYTLEDGILTLSGTGATYDYNSVKTAPWYEYRDKIYEIKIEEGITKLGTQLFASCTLVKELIVPEGVVEISGNAFIKASSLEKVSLPTTLQEIGKYAFSGTKLEEITYLGTEEQWNDIQVGANNNCLSTAILSYKEQAAVADQGICGKNTAWIYYTDGTLEISGTGTTYAYNSVKTAPWAQYREGIVKVVAGEGVTGLGSQAFASCTALEMVECPDSLLTIDSNAFIKCSNLKTITIGLNLNQIGRYAFSGTSLETIRYRGTEENWSKIQIGDKNEPLLSADIVYVK